MEMENNPNSIHKSTTGNNPIMGILEWFHIHNYQHVESAIRLLKQLGVKHLRTGVSWADYHTPDGEKWYEWLIPYLASHFTLLPCFLYTPPSLGIEPRSSSPPRNPKDFADFLDVFIRKYGEHFEYVELWNEPNNQSEYDFFLDPAWQIFSDMIGKAAFWVKRLGKKTVLGGMSPVDPNWLEIIARNGVLQYIDVIGIHGFPGTFDAYWKGWKNDLEEVNAVLKVHGLKKEIWITETGYSTWRYDERRQITHFLNTLDAPVSRIYWYSLTDLPGHLPTINGHRFDKREYHFGLIDATGKQKLLYRMWASEGLHKLRDYNWITQYDPPADREKHILVTGGAGFIGTNLVHRLLSEGFSVTVLDNLSRPGVEHNLKWLREQHSHNLNIMIADVRDPDAVETAVSKVSHVFHLAGQVAVTSSLDDPAYDFEINVMGTLNILEAIRRSEHKPSLIYTSTNKVYGNLQDIVIKKDTSRYYPEDIRIETTGINENRNLDFHSPYGSSKGSADQYVLDYARSFGLKNLVFRMSCIYGPHQYGTEDQGWVAHFILKALKKEKIILYGDGMQVRDILYVDDLINAFMVAWKDIDKLASQVFNMGGGPLNAISLIELIKLIEEYENNTIPVEKKDWRKGDQLYYVSNTSRFTKATGWEARVAYDEGVRKLYNWFCEHFDETGKENLFLQKQTFINL
jgi:CDP-paratose 2-epimerase